MVRAMLPQPQISLPWVEPLAFAHAAQARGEDFALLYSGLRTSYSGQCSFLACEPQESLCTETFVPLPDGLWFGYMGYGLKDSLERLPPDEPWGFALPHLRMTRFATVYRFDHDTKTLTCHGRHTLAPMAGKETAPHVLRLSSNMTRAEYLAHVARLRDAIHAGELYQANLTRKFYGEFASAPDALALFARLAAISPAPYAAFLKLGDAHILSSSPERFVKIDKGAITARPIKGSAARASDPAELARSIKDRAENLMIVDLMRNDFARSCAPGSVTVEGLYEVDSFTTVHHMASTVNGHLNPGVEAMDAVTACFPPGSMTGAPKIRAMEWCTRLERNARGVYGGALGWMTRDSCDLSVVIRTLIVQGARFEFQVGGGIVADSEPEKEWEETLVKAEAIRHALGLEAETLRRL